MLTFVIRYDCLRNNSKLVVMTNSNLCTRKGEQVHSTTNSHQSVVCQHSCSYSAFRVCILRCANAIRCSSLFNLRHSEGVARIRHNAPQHVNYSDWYYQHVGIVNSRELAIVRFTVTPLRARRTTPNSAETVVA